MAECKACGEPTIKVRRGYCPRCCKVLELIRNDFTLMGRMLKNFRQIEWARMQDEQKALKLFDTQVEKLRIQRDADNAS